MDKFIENMKEIRAAYIKKHGREPYIYGMDDYEGIQLVGGIKKRGATTKGLRPYMKRCPAWLREVLN